MVDLEPDKKYYKLMTKSGKTVREMLKVILGDFLFRVTKILLFTDSTH